MSQSSSIFNRFSLVKQVPIFKKCNWFELQKISRKAVIIEYKKGEIICKQNNPPDAFYCLISGRVQAYSVNTEGKKYDVDFIRRGMHFGIISLLTGENHSLSFEVINDSVVLKIDKDDFHAILKSIPQLGIELSHSLSKRIRRQNLESKSIFESTIISVHSPVSGSGGSTYAVNLALSLQKESHKKVILVNISTTHHSRQPNPSKLEEATPQWKKQAVDLNSIIDDHDKIINSISSGELQIDLLNVIFSPEDLSLLNQVSHFVTALVTDYHFIVLDLPNEKNELVLKTLAQSDIIHLVTLDRKPDLKMTREIIYQLEENLKENFDRERIQVIISDPQGSCYLSFEEVNKEIDFDVYTQLPFIHRSELNVAVLSNEMSVIVPAPESEYAKAVTRIARTISGVLVGLVLGGGAALGLAHIGVLRVLEQENIPVDIIVGSSMGALIASFWVTGKDSEALAQLASEFKSQKGLLKLFDPVIPISGLIGGRAIKWWLKKRGLSNKTFYSTRIPLKIVAYDLIKREEIVLDSGSITEAVRKSIAIPGVLVPVLEKERVIIDGGVLNPLPTNVLARLGIKKIIAVNVLQSPEHVTQGYLEEQAQLKKESKLPFMQSPWAYIRFRMMRVFCRIFTPNISDIIVRSLQASEYVIAEQNAQYADVLIQPDLVGINWFELYKVDDLIRLGETAARRAFPEIKKLVEE